MKGDDNRKPPFDAAEPQTPSTRGSSVYGNRETPETSSTGGGAWQRCQEPFVCSLGGAGDESCSPRQFGRRGPFVNRTVLTPFLSLFSLPGTSGPKAATWNRTRTTAWATWRPCAPFSAEDRHGQKCCLSLRERTRLSRSERRQCDTGHPSVGCGFLARPVKFS